MGYDVELDFGGITHQWDNLPISMVESYNLFSVSAHVRSVSLQLQLDVDVNQKIAAGYRLDVSPVRIYEAGSDVVELAGKAQHPQWGLPEEPVKFSVREAGFDVANTWPSWPIVEQVKVDIEASKAANFQDMIEQVRVDPMVAPMNYNVEIVAKRDLGTLPAVIIGHPGAGESSSAVWPATPAIYIDNRNEHQKLLLACHATDPGAVWIMGPKSGSDGGDTLAYANLPITIEEDLSGRRVTTCDISAASTTFDLEAVDSSWYAAWSTGETPTPTDGISGRGGDLILTLLNQCQGLRIDYGRIGQVVDNLNGYQFAGFSDQVVDPWKFLQERILSLLPVSAVVGRNGLYLAPWLPDVRTVDELYEGHQVSIESTLSYERIKIINDLTLSYQFQADSDTFRQIVKIDPLTNAYCELSRQAYGMQSETIEAQLVDDPATAGRMASWMARAYAFPPLRLSLRVDAGRYSLRQVGDTVQVVLPSYTIDQKGLICEIERYGEPFMRIDILLFDKHVRK